MSPRSLRGSFSVISSDSEMEWFDPDVLSNNGTGVLSSATSGCSCSGGKMVAYYEERLVQLQSEIDSLKARIMILESPLSHPIVSIAALFKEIFTVGTMFQLECTLSLLSLIAH
ncbi:hypothetical protein PSACC_02198 [Paramicrosporidium saccamoebae]|uniref:Uncharacterized protein n=1 Tax=Paramicrosporidium saccamoebae TaxID=1246581 RepID=A0A2H9TJM9_9FUNG|nr:hypothetical protein PSACC_02198 [Paramicrosporidium saccamoebae]